MNPEPGIYPGVAFDEYRQWPYVNNTLLHIIATRSAAHAKVEMDNPSPPTEAMRFGASLHCRVLECDKFPSRYVIAPQVDRRTKVGKETYAVFESAIGGKEILADTDYANIQNIAAAIERHKIIRFVKQGEAEVCIVWDDKKTKVRCKARLDYLHKEREIIVDVKSTRNASADDFSRSIYTFGYHQQAAWYCDGLRTLLKGEPLFVIIACEKEPPFGVAGYECHEEIIRAGRNDYQRSLKMYAACMKSGVWPGYHDGVQIINLPKWALEKAGVGPHQILLDDDTGE